MHSRSGERLKEASAEDGILPLLGKGNRSIWVSGWSALVSAMHASADSADRLAFAAATLVDAPRVHGRHRVQQGVSGALRPCQREFHPLRYVHLSYWASMPLDPGVDCRWIEVYPPTYFIKRDFPL